MMNEKDYDYYKENFGTLADIAASLDVDALSVSEMNAYPNALFCLKDDTKRALLDDELSALGFQSFRIFNDEGKSSLLLELPDGRLLRLTERKGEEQSSNADSYSYSGGGEVPKSSAILQPIHSFYIENIRCLVVPKVGQMKGLTKPQEDMALRMLQQKLLDDGLVCVDVDNGGNIHRQNVGWLSNGAPVLIDVDGVVSMNQINNLEEYAGNIARALEIFEKAKVNVPPFAWEDKQGRWQQHKDFPEIESGLPPKQKIMSVRGHDTLAEGDIEKGKYNA